MEALDVNSNGTGGSDSFRKRMREARALAGSPRKKQRIDDILLDFKPNTPGIHRGHLHEFISSLRAGGA